ncbi:DUF262 domain-containing protein [Bacillus inaquosorum]|uniref:DUF262 domain-containing protein n=1 Tax=Bacillus inaquosorum TaxID=483913 RepID=UPI00227EBE7E|nr:DUF262 domain-containing protein [Bacillus inaquosorum]MCY8056488.1 DUF262 domain-containing protein [Bacillus inaquosorum]MCY9397641.1 DUF262 domain-containing protein [Bacillus inaquosorum]
MDIQNNRFGVKQFMSMIDRGTVRSDYPIQRAGGQWKPLQKSYLIHSLAQSYPIPPLYFLGDKETIEVVKKGKTVEELVTVRSVLDGKQRLTNLYEFIKNEYKLDPATPDVKIDGMEYEMEGKFFEELDEEVQDAILSAGLLCYTIDANTASDEEIEDLFFRMNNGSPLTIQQKAKAHMGVEWATRIQELGNHVLVTELSAFSKTQIVSEGHLTAIIQTMMMMDDSFHYKNVSQKVISEYTETFKEDTERKLLLCEKVKDAMDYLVDVFSSKEKLLLKKVHFPMTLVTALRAKELEIEPEDFRDWVLAFKEAFKPSKKKDGTENTITIIPTNYKDFTGKGTTDRDKAEGRMKEMVRHFEEYAKVHKLIS